jgi:predicted DNA-binding antitoxin AbrB/MazE fold protein
MAQKLRAIYEKGALYLLEPVDWPEHSEVEISVEPVAAASERLRDLLREGRKLAGRTDPEAEAERARLNALIREEMYRDRPDVGTPAEELAKVLGFDPNDEAKLAALAEAQRRAILASFPLSQSREAAPRIGFDLDEDDIIYS